MPYQQTLGHYRGRRTGFNMQQAVTLAKRAMQFKKEYDKAKAKAAAKPKRGRPKGSKNKKGTKASRAAAASGHVSGPATYTAIPQKSLKARTLAKLYPQVLDQVFYITSPESYTEIDPQRDGTLTNPRYAL